MSQFDENRESIGSTSTGLLTRAKGRDEDAWKRLVRLYSPLVYHWVRSAGLKDADAQDLLQEVFSAVAGGLERFRKDRPGDTFRGWLRTITRSKLADHYRRAKGPRATGGSDAQDMFHSIPDVLSDSSGSDSSLDERLVQLGALELIRSDFAEKTWRAFWRCAVEGESPAEVAADLRVTPSAVRLAKSRVLRRLREELA